MLVYFSELSLVTLDKLSFSDQHPNELKYVKIIEYTDEDVLLLLPYLPSVLGHLNSLYLS